MAKTNIEMAQQTQEKFDFYMTALVFTLLGLSIQTASFGNSNTANLLELSGWISFLLSGLASLYRLELVPNVYVSADGLNSLKKQKRDIFHSKNEGQKNVFIIEENKSENIDDYIKDLDNKISILEEHLKSVKKDIESRYIFHRWSFIAGMLFMILSRSYAPIAKIILCK